MLGLAYVVVLAIIALGVPLALDLETRVNDEVRSQAASQADVLAATASDMLAPQRRPELQRLVDTAAGTVRGRIIVVDSSGIVLADSAGTSRVGSSYASRPEIASALQGGKFQAQRSSRTLGEQILATAVPILHEGQIAGAVRVTQSVAAVNAAIARVQVGLGILALVVLAIGLGFAALIAREIALPLHRLQRVARVLAGGDLSARAQVEGSTEQRSLARSFNEMADRIGKLLEAQKAFVADSSHQLRTPLTGLRLRLEETKAAGLPPAAAGEVDAAMAEVDRLAQIVDELLVLARAGERRTRGELLSLDELTDQAMDRWRGSAEERPIRLLAAERSGGRAWCARADADRALDALIENALRYCPPNSEVTLASLPGRIEIRDRGPGLAPGEEQDVFERFHRGSAGRLQPGGSGLGLAIAGELAKAWGGRVSLHARPGGGTIATLALPPAQSGPRDLEMGRRRPGSEDQDHAEGPEDHAEGPEDHAEGPEDHAEGEDGWQAQAEGTLGT